MPSEKCVILQGSTD